MAAAAPFTVIRTGGVVSRGSRYWSWSNPAVREVTTNVAGIAGTTGAVAGVGTLLAGILGKRKRDMDNNMVVDNLPVVAGGTTVVNRSQYKRKLKSGRLKNKLTREVEEFVQRWQRIYNFGASTTAYPSATNGESLNPGVVSLDTWPTQVNNAIVGGRLCLSHVAPLPGLDGWQMLPGYLFDLTCWNNSSNVYTPVPMKRFLIDSVGDFRWTAVSQVFNNANSVNNRLDWGPESGPSGTGVPTSSEQKAVLAWSDIRLAFAGSTNNCVKVHVEMVQFHDPKYTFDFHPDGESVISMSQLDRNEVNQFWFNEFKRGTFHPMTVNMYNRKKALKVLMSETFCINAEDLQNGESGPVTCVKQYFKRFNRLVNWNWNKPGTTVSLPWVSATAGGMENPDFQQVDQGALHGYADPKARIYLYIRAENFTPVAGSEVLTSAFNREVTFDVIIRNKWKVQT